MRITEKTLRFVRAAVNMEQVDLAKASGLSRGLISAIERNERPLTKDAERKFRRAIGLSDEMIGRIVDLHWDIQKELNNKQ